MNRFDLLVQIVFTLTLVHLAFDAPTDALFDLEDVDFDFHLTHDVFKAGFDAAQFKHFLLDFKFNRQMRDDGVRQMRTIVNGRQRIQNLHRDFFVQLDVLLEFLQHRAAQGLNLSTATINIADDFRLRLQEIVFIHNL